MSPSRGEAASELLARRESTEHLIPFFKYVNPTFDVSEHHEKIAAAFERVEQGLVDLLIVNIPPRHTKSELLTKAGTAWYLGRHPERQVITCSYGDELAQEYGRHTRNRIDSQDYKNIFPNVSLRQDSQAANRWHTNAGGIFISAGIGSGITGRGAHLGIVDDPHKDWAEAKSPTIRKHIEDWWDTVFTTRMMPPPIGAIVLIMTRWDKYDLTWYALETTRGTGWRVEHVVMPAIDTKGKALWPGTENKWWPVKVLQSMPIKKVNEKWMALYQQDPIENAHSKMQRSWFKIVDNLPADCNQGVRFWDCAATEPAKGKDPDYTAGCRIRFSPSKKTWYITDMVHFQGSPKSVDDAFVNTASLDGKQTAIREEQEGGSAGKGVVSARAILLAGYDYRPIKPVASKEIRANPLASQAEAGNVALLRGPWNETFLQEAEQFPNGAHDDQIDSASGAFEQMTQVSALYELTKQQAEELRASMK